ncbi:TPA: sigma-70 family RNA polymerase sigma factor [Klebsiella pneumoniae]|jgi:RNA polymerase sigma-70 factor, ECF subfamily|uniref:sigma-70 family RNA polymerase sigma factor n=1 Tax=Pseudomonas aeruginosa TaxID=287 RepID=UPI0012B04551|nr:sigma-70 family RNA polymerase sigma factor [Pseudomonas aeruginosa]QGL85407.1 sigma-70 family RNA polymerase sigma factor [Stenotrophomonas maltophilia]EME9750933.1 sigma-70 family RNA polymerase sigma factor [Pseudomonas aeruginosa]MBI8786629.1 sigma-70 family RNA polymerase sigma factor [Pseudomonas aeruginosa]MCO2824387.1 sigma-70 family RNA polymerase sigma factor [Pseudomonas aeruginosa]MCO3133406.1 sigma-70 family RNA polymerase sigma factor [Pseudomonas aeruginosa]
MSTAQDTPNGKPHDAGFDCVLSAWQAHEKELLAFLIHRASDRDAAEDLLQEVFLKSMRQGQGFCALGNPRAWLFQVARNALIDSARLAKPLEELPDHLAAPPTEERPPVDELDTCIERNLPDLEAEDRHIIDACDLQGQTVRAYAEAHELTLAAAKSRLLRARKRLRDRLVQNCQVRFDEAGQVCCHIPRTST